MDPSSTPDADRQVVRRGVRQGGCGCGGPLHSAATSVSPAAGWLISARDRATAELLLRGGRVRRRSTPPWCASWAAGCIGGRGGAGLRDGHGMHRRGRGAYARSRDGAAHARRLATVVANHLRPESLLAGPRSRFKPPLSATALPRRLLARFAGEPRAQVRHSCASSARSPRRVQPLPGSRTIRRRCELHGRGSPASGRSDRQAAADEKQRERKP